MPTEIRHQVVPLQEVLDYYAKNFKPKNGEKILRTLDTIVDTGSRKVVFELVVDVPPDNRG